MRKETWRQRAQRGEVVGAFKAGKTWMFPDLALRAIGVTVPGSTIEIVEEDKRTFRYHSISLDALSSLDLREEARPGMAAFSIEIMDEAGQADAERAEALYDPASGRLGIAWGADATWADVESVESGIEMWLNDGETWNQRN